jgi:hypothetical protein
MSKNFIIINIIRNEKTKQKILLTLKKNKHKHEQQCIHKYSRLVQKYASNNGTHIWKSAFIISD